MVKGVKRDGKALRVSGKASTNEECCCDPCVTCYPDYLTTRMPNTITLTTPFGDLSCVKTGNCPYGTCSTVSGVTYIEFACTYDIVRQYSCQTSSQPVSKVCRLTGAYNFDCDGTPTRTSTLTGNVVHLFTQHVAYTSVTTVWASSGNAVGGLVIKQRKNCTTGVWQINIVMSYQYAQYLSSWFKGTRRTQDTVDGRTTGLCTGDLTQTYFGGVTNFCAPFNSGAEEQIGSWVAPSNLGCGGSYGGNYGGVVTANTGWISHTGLNAAKTFTPTQGPSNSGYMTFNAPTSSGNSYFTCSGVGNNVPVSPSNHSHVRTCEFYCTTAPCTFVSHTITF